MLSVWVKTDFSREFMYSFNILGFVYSVWSVTSGFHECDKMAY